MTRGASSPWLAVSENSYVCMLVCTVIIAAEPSLAPRKVRLSRAPEMTTWKALGSLSFTSMMRVLGAKRKVCTISGAVRTTSAALLFAGNERMRASGFVSCAATPIACNSSSKSRSRLMVGDLEAVASPALKAGQHATRQDQNRSWLLVKPRGRQDEGRPPRSYDIS